MTLISVSIFEHKRFCVRFDHLSKYFTRVTIRVCHVISPLPPPPPPLPLLYNVTCAVAACFPDIIAVQIIAGRMLKVNFNTREMINCWRSDGTIMSSL